MSKLIITLTSVPPRYSKIGPTLQSLLAQNAAVSGIYLYIPDHYKRFPDWNGTLPKVPKGVEIRRTPLDLGPATKVLPASQEFAGQDVDILFCDDDRIYAPGWAAEFLRAKRNKPGCAITKRGLSASGLVGTTDVRKLQPRAVRRPVKMDVEFHAKRLLTRVTGGGAPERRLFRRSGYVDMFEGCSGVLVRPEFFDDAAFDIPKVAWLVDDVWLSGILAKNDIGIWLVANTLTPKNTDAQQQAPLAAEVVNGDGRHKINQAAVRHVQQTFGVWLG